MISEAHEVKIQTDFKSDEQDKHAKPYVASNLYQIYKPRAQTNQQLNTQETGIVRIYRPHHKTVHTRPDTIYASTMHLSHM